VELPLSPPIPPMLAKLERELPRGDYLYEPKWDGFRCLAFRSGDEVALQSRHGRPFARYFPEVVEALRKLPRAPFVLDGELVAGTNEDFDFLALLGRIHPAASRVERLSTETPARFIAFDVLVVDGEDVTSRRFVERRRLLEEIATDITPITDDADEATEWLYAERGIDGVVAKHIDLPYTPGARTMIKVKQRRTADCVVAGFRWLADRPLPSSLLLAVYDDAGTLHHVGVASAFTQRGREQLLERLQPLIVPLEGHPWEHGFLLGGNPGGRLRGSAGAWMPGMTQDWTPVAPELVCEVSYDQVDNGRFRHPARFLHWRPDRDARSCTFGQLETRAAR
jgi:ATP-dependent DNA ligase